MGHFRYRVPTEDDLRWQLSTTVASGCDGILWFYYYGQNNGNNYRGAPIDELGEESETYTRMRRVQQIFHRRYGEMVTRLNHGKTWHFQKAYGDYPLYMNYDIPHLRKMESAHGIPGIVSTFYDENGEQYLCLCNNSPFESGLFSFIFDPCVTSCTRYWDNGHEIDFKVSHHDAVYQEHSSFTKIGVYLAPGQMEIFKVGFEKKA